MWEQSCAPLGTCSCSNAAVTIPRPSAAVIKRKFLPDSFGAAVDCAWAPLTSAKQSQIMQRTSESPNVHFELDFVFISRITRLPPVLRAEAAPVSRMHCGLETAMELALNVLGRMASRWWSGKAGRFFRQESRADLSAPIYFLKTRR